jgi:hypothetical protein
MGMNSRTEQEDLFYKWKYLANCVDDLKYIIQNPIEECPLTEEDIKKWIEESIHLLRELNDIRIDTISFIIDKNGKVK